MTMKWVRKWSPMCSAYYDWCGPRRKHNLIDITREEWITWWENTGVFDYRGTHKGQYYMARIDWTQPFSLDNIELKWRGQKPRVKYNDIFKGKK